MTTSKSQALLFIRPTWCLHFIWPWSLSHYFCLWSWQMSYTSYKHKRLYRTLLGTISAYYIQPGCILCHPLSWCKNVFLLPSVHIRHLYVKKLISHFTNVYETKLLSTYVWQARLKTTRFSSTMHFYTVYIYVCIHCTFYLCMLVFVLYCVTDFVWVRDGQRPDIRTDVHSARARAASLCHV